MINKSAKMSLLWRVSETIGSEAVSFAVFAVLARALAPGEFGSVALAVAMMGVLQISLYHGWIEALITGTKSQSREHLVLAGTLGVGFAFLVAGVFALLAVPIGMALHRPDFPPILWALLPTLPLRALCTSMLAELRLQMRFRATALRTLAGVAIGGLIAIWTAHQGFGRWALVVQQWTVEITGFVVLVWSTRRGLVTLSPSRTESALLLRKVIPVMLSQLMSQSLRRLDLIVLGFFLADYSVGILFLVNRLIYAAQMVTQYAMADVALVVLSKSGVPRGRNAGLLRDVNAIGTATGCMAFVALGLVGSDLVPVVFGAKWRDAVAPVTISAIGAMFGATTAMISTTMLAANNERRFARLNAFAAITRIVMCVIGAHWGLMGVAIASALSGVVTLGPFLRAQAQIAEVGAMSISDRSLLQLLACTVLVSAWALLRPTGLVEALVLGTVIALVAIGVLLLQLRTSMRCVAAATQMVPAT